MLLTSCISPSDSSDSSICKAGNFLQLWGNFQPDVLPNTKCD